MGCPLCMLGGADRGVQGVCQPSACVPVLWVGGGRVCVRGCLHVHRHGAAPTPTLGCRPQNSPAVGVGELGWGPSWELGGHPRAGGSLPHPWHPPGEEPQWEALGREGGSWVESQGGNMAPFPRMQPRPFRSTQGRGSVPQGEG